MATAAYSGDIIPERQAKSSRNAERHQIGLAGDIIPDSRATSLGISMLKNASPALVVKLASNLRRALWSSDRAQIASVPADKLNAMVGALQQRMNALSRAEQQKAEARMQADQTMTQLHRQALAIGSIPADKLSPTDRRQQLDAIYKQMQRGSETILGE